MSGADSAPSDPEKIRAQSQTSTPRASIGRRRAPAGAQPAKAPDDNELDKALPTVPDEERRLAVGFYIAFAAGVALSLGGFIRESVIAGIVGFGGPLIAVILFFLWGYFYARLQIRSDLRQKFADSCYFLGFLFTMVALMVGFLPAGLAGSDITSQEILRFFGMALGATALGLVFRIVVLQSGRTMADDAVRVENELHIYARRLSHELKLMLDEVGGTRVTLVQTLGGLADDLRRPLVAGAVAASQSLEQAVAVASGALVRQAEAVDRIADQFRAQAEAKTRELDWAIADAVSMQQGIAASAAAIDEAGTAIVKKLVASTDEATGAVNQAARQMQTLVDALVRLDTGRTAIDRAVAGAGESATQAGMAFDAISDRLEAVKSDSERLPQQIGEICASLEESRRTIEAAKARQAQLPQEIEEVGRVVILGIQQAGHEAVDAVTAEARGLHESLSQVTREAADAVSLEANGLKGSLIQTRQEAVAALMAEARGFEGSLSQAVTRLAALVDQFSSQLRSLGRSEADR